MTNNKSKKPFGLQIGVRVALKAINDNIAPASTILCNLFQLRKETVFPLDLDVYFFSTLKREPAPEEKKAISYILDEFKKPGVDKALLLENLLETDWVKKKSPQKEIPQKTFASKKKNAPKKAIKTAVTPIVIVKSKKTI